MKLIAVYVVLVLIGDAIAFGLGRVVEQWWPAISLPAFLAMFFFVFFAGWRVAVRVT